ncbi:hypothetical protein PRIPAC_80312 [Pristionchus pacificus]|uniref:Uncharacterized protein n=1 Tax=Pristionchus pacificus TaxID=54126 RepID=A0A2A6CQ83_PRIPA|nr:hypothetical protein PRIPAC_80312 [Pristionchus pacificus]|eukprot:PDM80280.1 hypothetical protein PRIPAC_32859 [Pristionchus pacificus]
MTSQFVSDYSIIHSILSNLHGHLSTRNNVITQFPQLSSSDEILQLSSTAMTAHLEVLSLMDDYKEAIASIEDKINDMEDGAKKEEEQRIFSSMETSTDGSTNLPVSLPLLAKLTAKQETKYDRAFEAATNRVSMLSRLPQKQPSTSTPSIQPVPDHSSALTYLPQAFVPLPPMRIEPFDGSNITLWSSFHSQFQSIIGSRSELSPLEKLNYLRSLLKGDALKLVQSIPIRDDLYSHTLDRLKVAYDRSNHSTALLYQKLMGMKPKSSRIEDQLNCVRDMINLVYHLDDSKNLDSLPLIEQLASRVNPSFVRKIWKLNPKSMTDALTYIDKELREELECRAVESAFHPNQITSIHSNPDSNSEQYIRPPNEKSHDSPKCDYCGSTHQSINCSKYKTSDERTNRISQIRVCRKCLQPNHNYNECIAKCGKCKGTHHNSICKSTTPPTHSNNTLIQAAAIVTNPWPQTRMHTATGVIRNPIHGTARDATVFLDTGSQISMISRSLSDKLKLEPIEMRVVSIAGITGYSDPQVADVVQYDLMTSSGAHKVEAIVQDTLGIPSMAVEALPSSDIQFIKDESIFIPPSKLTSHTVSPEILLGLDITHTLTKNTESIRLPSGLDFLYSQLGPIIIGSKPFHSIETPDDQAERDEKLDKAFKSIFSGEPNSEYEDSDAEYEYDGDHYPSLHYYPP